MLPLPVPSVTAASGHVCLLKVKGKANTITRTQHVPGACVAQGVDASITAGSPPAQLWSGPSAPGGRAVWWGAEPGSWEEQAAFLTVCVGAGDPEGGVPLPGTRDQEAREGLWRKESRHPRVGTVLGTGRRQAGPRLRGRHLGSGLLWAHLQPGKENPH